MFHLVYNTTHISEERIVKIELQNKKTLSERTLHQEILSGNQYTLVVRRYKSYKMYFMYSAWTFLQKLVSFRDLQQVSLIIELFLFVGRRVSETDIIYFPFF